MVFKDTIRGLERLFKKDIDAPKLILVTGPPGSMKSSFAYAVMTKYLNKTNEFGLYATFEETGESHLKNMESMGVEMSLNLQITDLTDLREDDDDDVDYLKFTENMIKHFRDTRGEKFTCFTLDSLGALYSLTSTKINMRKRMYHFFRLLRESNLIAFIIMERSPEGESQLLGNEGFLSDGIIYLGLRRRQGRLIRYLQVEKMRASQHSMEMHAIEVKNDGISILGPIFDQ